MRSRETVHVASVQSDVGFNGFRDPSDGSKAQMVTDGSDSMSGKSLKKEDVLRILRSVQLTVGKS